MTDEVVPASALREAAPEHKGLATIQASPAVAYELYGLTLVDSKVDAAQAQADMGGASAGVYETQTFARPRFELRRKIEARRVGVRASEGTKICPICGSRNTQDVGKQSRSADEGTTGYARCRDCCSIFFPGGKE